VTCNDNSRGNFQISFDGQIYENPDSLYPLALSETSLTFHPENRDEELKLKVKNVSEEKLRMRLIDYPYDLLKIDVTNKEIKPGKEKEIKVEIEDSFEGDNFKKSFTVELSDSASTRFTVPVALLKMKPKPPVSTEKGDSVYAAPVNKKKTD
jgi:hypothetical protein